MALRCTSLVNHPLHDVFDWHARPGALQRLTPPWQPVHPVQEADNLRDGTAVLRLPSGLRWYARHQPAAYDSPHRFVDELTRLGPATRPPIRWRHTHDFNAEDQANQVTVTRITDTLDTPIPARLLQAMFTYRHHQLADDLDALARTHAWSDRPLTVAMTGSSGLIGTALRALLTTSGHRVIRLVRHPANSEDERHWQPDAPDEDLLTGIDAVVHLAGAPIAGRFTPAHRHAIRDSRIGPTRRLAEAAADAGLAAFVSASAIGIYGPDRGDEILTEDSPPGSGFLADVVSDWETATTLAADAGIRTVTIRTGIVQSASGGTLPLLSRLFRTGLGGRLGDGRQWLAWIGLDDLADIYRRALQDNTLHGPINAVAPDPVRNIEYTKILATVLHRPATIPVTAIGPQLLLGTQGATELALASQRVIPQRLQDTNHTFRHPQLTDALSHTLGRAHPYEVT